MQQLRGKTLHVSYPGDSSSDYTLVTRDDNGQKTGSVVAFMNEIAAKGGFFYELHNVSEASTDWSARNAGGSSWTACVHEVALGETDICIGNFWVTIQRLQLATFTSSLYNDEWKLVVREEESSGLWLEAKELYEHMKTPAKPFTRSA